MSVQHAKGLAFTNGSGRTPEIGLHLKNSLSLLRSSFSPSAYMWAPPFTLLESWMLRKYSALARSPLPLV